MRYRQQRKPAWAQVWCMHGGAAQSAYLVLQLCRSGDVLPSSCDQEWVQQLWPCGAALLPARVPEQHFSKVQLHHKVAAAGHAVCQHCWRSRHLRQQLAVGL